MGIGKHLALAAGVLLGMGSIAQAGPDRISVLLGSNHVGATRSFEEVNPGIFLTWTEALFAGRADISVGAFRNSYGGGSVAAVTAFPIIRKKDWGIDLFGGLAWYPGEGQNFSTSAGDIIPLAGIQGRLGPTFVQVIPAGGNAVDATISFGLTFPLN